MRGKRLARLLQIIPLLRGTRSWNARRLADRFQTSRRNIHRDLAVLELAGVPFYYDPDFGDGGAYRIQPDWWFPPVQLTQQEAVDLAVLSGGADSDSGVPLLTDAGSARDKVLATGAAEVQKTIRAASELIEILSLRMADHSHCRPAMATMQKALLTGRQVEGRYASPHQKKAVAVRLQPRRVFLAGMAWYAACHDNETGRTKLYRLARFKDLKVTGRAMTVSGNFSLREFLGNAWTVYRGDRDWHVEILFDAQAAPLVSEVQWHRTQKLIPQPDGSLIFQATVSGLDEIKWWVLGWGPRARVLRPVELVGAVGALAKGTVRQYQ